MYIVSEISFKLYSMKHYQILQKSAQYGTENRVNAANVVNVAQNILELCLCTINLHNMIKFSLFIKCTILQISFKIHH